MKKHNRNTESCSYVVRELPNWPVLVLAIWKLVRQQVKGLLSLLYFTVYLELSLSRQLHKRMHVKVVPINLWSNKRESNQYMTTSSNLNLSSSQ
jgi:hypothetical protein